MTPDDLTFPPDFDLNAVLSEDPTKLTRQDRNVIVAYYRNQRADREAAASAGKRVARATAPPTKGLAELLNKRMAGPVNRRGM
jgi:hypothetical protein